MSVVKVRHIVVGQPRMRGTARRRTLSVYASAAAAAVVLFAGGPADSQARTTQRFHVERDDAVQQGPVEVSVRIQGRWTPLYQASNRADRWYLEAREHANYEVRVRNTSGERVAFVIAVDGLNAINGLQSRLNASEPMYVLDPYASATIKGWRKDLKNVSRFVFVDEKRSYAERTGQANGDMGWIRVAAFREQPVIAYREDWGGTRGIYRDGAGSEVAPSPTPTMEKESADRKSEGRANGAAPQGAYDRPMAQAVPEESNPGTGWGANERDRVRKVDFVPQQFACAQVILRYEYKSALVSLGILPWRGSQDRLWERENGQLGFAQPPRW